MEANANVDPTNTQRLGYLVAKQRAIKNVLSPNSEMVINVSPAVKAVSIWLVLNRFKLKLRRRSVELTEDETTMRDVFMRDAF